jgi:hypothetical protein
VRETWPQAILLPSRHHLAALMAERALADGIPERIRLETPLVLGRPLPWTGERAKHWGWPNTYTYTITSQQPESQRSFPASP